MKCCRNFYITAIVQLKQRFNLDDPLYDLLDFLVPKRARNLTPAGLSDIFERFPVLKSNCDSFQAEIEWRSHANLTYEELGCTSDDAVLLLDAETYWRRVLSFKQTPSNLKFLNLKKVIVFMFSLPSSNASAERVFSALKMIKTELRNSLSNNTLVNIVRIKHWLKAHGWTSSTVEFDKEMIQRVLNVRANKRLLDDYEKELEILISSVSK